MNCPKIKKVEAIGKRTLKIEFDNQQTKKYDVTPLLKLEMFQPLKNPVLFKSVKVEGRLCSIVGRGNRHQRT